MVKSFELLQTIYRISKVKHGSTFMVGHTLPGFRKVPDQIFMQRTYQNEGHKTATRTGWFERDPSVYPPLPDREPSIVRICLIRILRYND